MFGFAHTAQGGCGRQRSLAGYQVKLPCLGRGRRGLKQVLVWLERKCLGKNRGLFASAKMFEQKQRSVWLQRKCLSKTEVCLTSAKMFEQKQRSVWLQRKCLDKNKYSIDFAQFGRVPGRLPCIGRSRPPAKFGRGALRDTPKASLRFAGKTYGWRAPTTVTCFYTNVHF